MAGGELRATNDGRIDLFAHTHLFRNYGLNAFLPSTAVAADFARRHDLVGGEWHSVSNQIPAAGMNTLRDGTRLEGVMMKENPDLLMYLYFNGSRSERVYWRPFFPASWYRTTGPDHFGLELMDARSNAAFAAPPILDGVPTDGGFTAHGWSDWVAKYSNWMLRRGPHDPGGYGLGHAFYVGTYLDNLVDPITYEIMDRWRRINGPQAWLTTNSLVQGSVVDLFAGRLRSASYPWTLPASCNGPGGTSTEAREVLQRVPSVY